MNAASRGLFPKGLHVARVAVGRARHRPHQRSSFSSTAPSHYAASLSSLLAHNTANSFHTSSPASTDYPVNIIDRQQSLHMLSTLLGHGDIAQARQTLANILESAPTDGDLDIFRQILATIAPSDSDSAPVDLIVQLGAATASRGYISFARTELLPLLEKFGTKELALQFEHQLSEAESSRQTIQNSNDVFEGASDDYTAILSESKPIQTLSPLDLILQQLPELLPDPELNDSATSIFEDEEETVIEQLSMNPSAHAHKTSVGMLHEILRAGKRDHAYQFLQDMNETRVHIPPHPIFAQAALDVVTTTEDKFGPHQIEECRAWLKLIPSYNSTVFRSTTLSIIAEVMNVFLRQQELDLRNIIYIALLFTSKGYSPHLSEAFEVIVSSVPVRYCRTLITSFRKAENTFFLRSRLPKKYQKERTAAFMNTLIRTLVLCNWRFEAERLARMNPSIISDDTKEYLIRPSPSPIDKSTKSPPSLEKYKNHPERPQAERDLVYGLRYLKKILHQNTHAPNPRTIAGFMARNVASDRTRGLQILADRAYRCNRAIRCSMILGEMILYRRMKLYDLVLETFVDHFYLYDVPEQMVLAHYKEIKARRQGEEEPITRVIDPTRTRGLITRKLWPQSGHYNLIWEVLLEKSSKDPKKIKELYKEFINILSHRPHQPYATPNDNRLGARSPTSQFSSSSFNPFFRHVMAAQGPKAGRKILNTMLELNITPEIRAYSELAGQLARYNCVEEVFELIDRLESGGSFQKSGRDHALPEPDLVFYTNIVRGFLIRRDAKSARRVVDEHIRRLFPDAQGQGYEDIVEDLHSLETLGPGWVYTRRHIIYPKPFGKYKARTSSS